MPENKKRLQFTGLAAGEEITQKETGVIRKTPMMTGTQAGDADTAGKSPPAGQGNFQTSYQTDHQTDRPADDSGESDTGLTAENMNHRGESEEFRGLRQEKTYLQRRRLAAYRNDPSGQNQDLLKRQKERAYRKKLLRQERAKLQDEHTADLTPGAADRSGVINNADTDSLHSDGSDGKSGNRNRYGSRRYFRRNTGYGPGRNSAGQTDADSGSADPADADAADRKVSSENNLMSEIGTDRSGRKSDRRAHRAETDADQADEALQSKDSSYTGIKSKDFPSERASKGKTDESRTAENASSRLGSRNMLSEKQRRSGYHGTAKFVSDGEQETAADSVKDELRKDKVRIRRMQQKRRKRLMRQGITETPDEMLLTTTDTERKRKRIFLPAKSEVRKWAVLLLIAGILAAAIYSSVSAVGVVGSGVIGGGASALTDNHSSMYTGSAIRQEIVSYAEAFIGRGKYVWGGNDLGTPENPGSGTDCSGFVQQVFAHFGISLPRTSYADEGAGVGIDYSEARPGDIIVYDGHVAIYAGDGQIVQAANEELGMCMGNALYSPIVAVRNVIPAEMDMAYTGDPVKLDDESKHLLATIVYHESGNQSYESKVAVAAEVLNRVKSSHFPNTVYDVLNQKNQYCNTDTEPAFRRMYNSTLPEDCWKAVEDAMNGADPTGGMCFHCTNDYWAAHYAGLGWPNLVIDDQTFHNWGRPAGYFNSGT